MPGHAIWVVYSNIPSLCSTSYHLQPKNVFPCLSFSIVACFLFHRKPSYDTEADPSEGLMNVLKKIYEDGDDDMKRTINKAWVESREKQAREDTEF